jgi:hypothetical protein
MREGKLVRSNTPGLYAIGDAQSGAELTNGQKCEVFLGGRWIQGIEQSNFKDSNGNVCGLCVGMKVRIS